MGLNISLAIAFLLSLIIPFSIKPVNGLYGIDELEGFRANPSVSELSQNKSSEIELAGNVTHVADGDTLDINGITIRLSLVNTSERGQDGFKESKAFVTSLCLGKKGELDVDDGQRRGDRFGREIGVVYYEGVNLNERLINESMANIITDYCDVSEFADENWAKTYC